MRTEFLLIRKKPIHISMKIKMQNAILCLVGRDGSREREREGGKAIDSLELGLFIFEECKPEPCMFNLFSTSE